MANLYEMWTGAQANGRERVKRGQLAGLVNPALSGDKSAQDRMMGLDPDMGMKVQGYADTRAKGQQESQQAAQKRLGSLASGVVQAAQGGDPASVQGAYQALLQEARANNPQAQLPDAYDPADLAEIHKLVALGGGAAESEQFTLAPGSARYDASGRAIASQPFAPAKPEYQMYESADGPVWLPKPMAGGAPPQGAPQPSAGPTGGASTLLESIIQQESGGNPNAVSPKGARGLMQLMPGTQRDPGFGVTPARDDSPEENVRMGTDYFNAMLSRYGGNEQLALAAYNAGPGSVDKAMQRAGGDPQRAISFLPEETRNYVPAVQGRVAQAPGGVGAIPISGVRPKPPKQSVPSGYRALPDGTLQAIPGGPAQVANDARADAAAARKAAEDVKASVKQKEDDARQQEATSATDQLVSAIDSLTSHAGFAELGTVTGDLKIRTPLIRSDVKDAQAQLQNIGGQVALSTMARLKALSSSGATGFGALSAPELKLLENAIATLQSDQISNVQLKASLKVIKDTLEKTKKWKPEGAAKPSGGGDLSPAEQQELDQLRTQLGRK